MAESTGNTCGISEWLVALATRPIDNIHDTIINEISGIHDRIDAFDNICDRTIANAGG